MDWTCKLECGVVFRREELRIHEKEKCPYRQVMCDHCEKDYISCEMNEHIEKCPKMRVSCHLKCSKVICREDMQQHLKHDCGMVQEACKLGCGVKLARNELLTHEKENCLQRKVKCKHCNNVFKSCKLNKHLEKCPMMNVSCNLCGTKIAYERMGLHHNYDCGMVQETCKLGCGVKLTRDKLKMHEKDSCVQRNIRCDHCFASVKFCDNSKHLKECLKVRVPCYLCSEEKCRKDMREHINQYCPEIRLSVRLLSIIVWYVFNGKIWINT